MITCFPVLVLALVMIPMAPTCADGDDITETTRRAGLD